MLPRRGEIKRLKDRKLAEGKTARQRELAAAALANLACNNDANKTTIVLAGAIPPLVALTIGGTPWQASSSETSGAP